MLLIVDIKTKSLTFIKKLLSHVKIFHFFMGDLAVATEMEKFLKVPIFSVSSF
jgi:hypothetical protein